MPTSRTRQSNEFILRSLSPSGRFKERQSDSSLSSASSAMSSGKQRSKSPTRVNLYSRPLSPTVRFSIDRSVSPSRSISVSSKHPVINNRRSSVKKTCMCSPTTHPGSFRCSLHKNSSSTGGNRPAGSSFPPHRLNMLRSAMTNSLVRIGGVEGELVRRSLTALIRPSSHQQRRHAAFQPRPSRLSVMSKAE